MKKTTKDGYSKRSLHHDIDDMPPLYEMKSNEVIREENQPPQNQVWIGSLINSVKLPKSTSEVQTKELRLSKQVDVDLKGSNTSMREQPQPARRELAKSKQSDSSRQVIESIVTSDPDRMGRQQTVMPSTSAVELFNAAVLSKAPAALLSPSAEARQVLASILTNQTKLSQFVENLVDVMVDRRTPTACVQNLELLVLLLKKLTQDNIEVKQTRYDIEIGFGEEEVRRKNRDIEQLRRRLAEKDQEARSMEEECEAIIQDMKDNIQLIAARKKEHLDKEPHPSGEQPPDHRSHSLTYHEDQERHDKGDKNQRGERGWTFSIKK